MTSHGSQRGKGRKDSCVWLLGALLALNACDPVTIPERSTGEVYDFRLIAGSEALVMRWPNGSHVRVHVLPVGDSARDALLADAFAVGSAHWQQSSVFLNFRMYPTSSPEAADVLLTWSDATLPVNTAECVPAGQRAYTTFCLSVSGDRLEPFPLLNGKPSMVRFIVTVRSIAGNTRDQVYALVAHELGHVLGIAQHSTNTDDLMYSNPLHDSPSARDRATIQILYQTRPDIVP